MSENKKSNVWLYAVILFTSAFIVLLFAGLSQIKMNKNLSNYRSQVNTTESEKNKYQQNFSSAQEMNKKLNEQISALENETSVLKNVISNLNNDKTLQEAANQRKDQVEENFHNVLSVYLKGNVVEAAGLLSSVDYSFLTGKDLEAFNALDQKVRSEAGEVLFEEGYAAYNHKKYPEAAAKLGQSFGYAKKEAFSDKCLYYLAWAEKKTGNLTGAVEYMKQLVQEYSESRYLRSAKSFINRYS
ncbi:MAG TPA: tetratricopeptide repeat protein [Clostridia bacterium]|nr:tetratricopeptide repeat protein [Clostridia bacterium]